MVSKAIIAIAVVVGLCRQYSRVLTLVVCIVGFALIIKRISIHYYGDEDGLNYICQNTSDLEISWFSTTFQFIDTTQGYLQTG